MILPSPTPDALDTVIRIPSLSSSASASHHSSSSTSIHAPALVPASASHYSTIPSATLDTRTTVSSVPIAASISNNRPRCHSKEPNYFYDYHCSLAQISTLLPKIIPKNPLPKKPISPLYPISSSVSYSNLNIPYKNYILSITNET